MTKTKTNKISQNLSLFYFMVSKNSYDFINGLSFIESSLIYFPMDD